MGYPVPLEDIKETTILWPAGLQLIELAHAEYQEAVAFARSRYQETIDCRLDTFYPKFLARFEHGSIVALLGIRCAGRGALFLEQYLDQPVELTLDAINLGGFQRSQIAEVGGLAAQGVRQATRLMEDVRSVLAQSEVEVVVCTANDATQFCLKRIGVNYLVLAEASESCLTNHQTDWGRYYQGSPKVLAGRVER